MNKSVKTQVEFDNVDNPEKVDQKVDMDDVVLTLEQQLRLAK